MNMDLSNLIGEFRTINKLNKTLFLDISEFSLFKNLKDTNKIIKIKGDDVSKNILLGDPFYLLDKIKEEFDLIIGDLPLGWKPNEHFIDKDKKINLKERKNWVVIFKSLFKLSKKGYAIFVIEPSIFGTFFGKKFIHELNKQGFYINAAFNTPENILKPYTSLRPLIVILSKNKQESIFVAELNELSEFKKILSNLKESTSKNLQEGLILNKDEFNGFEKYEISKELDILSKQYNKFKKYELSEVADEINIGKKLEEQENSIYIPKIGTSKVICNLKESKIKHQNLVQIVLNKKIVNAEYLSLFFNTSVGKLSLKLLVSGTFIPHINKSDIESLIVAIPDKFLQEKIIKSNEKLKQLKNKINIFEEEIALNPLSVYSIENDLNSLLNSLNLLNESDKILSLIRKGESKTLEFKSTLRKSIEKEGIPDSVIEKATLKNLAGFMNSKGGILLVGVNDNGKILGLENDQFKSKDDLLKHVKNLIKRDFEPEFYDFIDYKIVLVSDKQLLMFECKPSGKPVFLGKDGEFFVRTNPATDKLSGKKMLEYVNTHFNKSNM